VTLSGVLDSWEVLQEEGQVVRQHVLYSPALEGWRLWFVKRRLLCTFAAQNQARELLDACQVVEL
jgi:hypothetical protein